MPDFTRGIPTIASLIACAMSIVLMFLLHKEKDTHLRKIYAVITAVILCASFFCLIFLIQGKYI